MDRLRERLFKIERMRDRLDMELNLERRMAAIKGRPVPRDHKHQPDLQRVRGKVCSTVEYPDGGSYTTWIMDGSSTSDCDDDKENLNPLSNQSCPLSDPVLIPSYKPQHCKLSSSSGSVPSAASQIGL
jgi:hypothetical protein